MITASTSALCYTRPNEEVRHIWKCTNRGRTQKLTGLASVRNHSSWLEIALYPEHPRWCQKLLPKRTSIHRLRLCEWLCERGISTDYIWTFIPNIYIYFALSTSLFRSVYSGQMYIYICYRQYLLSLVRCIVLIRAVSFSVHNLFADPPEIEVDQPVVFSGEGAEAMLYCIVHGDKQPDVSTYLWFCGIFSLGRPGGHVFGSSIII